ncbi:DDE-type integrase/transposase/recombinase [Halobacteria archaeon AArc-curdl1]|uniref:DDE-type integrase/transposase/recombinase n=1 Tax=Natronosalvus hydrolyticus TaxID=2979988 RepID=A0AAP2ZA57_9EURY|nr:DDE-type integrase/transposase/recombinase [Halobacteria archaeon AArc-curdl1]
MPETGRFKPSTGWIDLDFVEREWTPCKIFEMGIRQHLAGLSLSNTVIILENLGVKRSRTAVHNWVNKADLQPGGGASPDRVAVDQKVIRINGEQYGLYTAVDPQTNRILHSRLFQTYTIAIGGEFLSELIEKHDVADALFLIDDAGDFIGSLQKEGLSYCVEVHGHRNQVERVYREVERRTCSFSYGSSHVDPATAESWLQAHAFCWNQWLN